MLSLSPHLVEVAGCLNYLTVSEMTPPGPLAIAVFLSRGEGGSCFKRARMAPASRLSWVGSDECHSSDFLSPPLCMDVGVSHRHSCRACSATLASTDSTRPTREVYTKIVENPSRMWAALCCITRKIPRYRPRRVVPVSTVGDCRNCPRFACSILPFKAMNLPARGVGTLQLV